MGKRLCAKEQPEVKRGREHHRLKGCGLLAIVSALITPALRTRWLPAIASLLLSIFATAAEAATVSQPSQSDVEAAYLFDFGKFVRWPAGADQGPMSICVAAPPSFSAGVEKVVANENINGRTLDVRRISRTEDASNCAILFIDATQREQADQLLQAVADKPTLTVSDIPDFLKRGGMIQFRLAAKRVRFSINLDAVNRARLVISSELLKVAMCVKGRTPEGGAQ